MKIVVDRAHRYACMRAHTATHILHAELGKIFPQTKQAGSYVGPDELRFDFFAERNLTANELNHITQLINNVISHNEVVTVQEMSYEDAIKTGAKAFFEDTYPEIVRVVSIGSEGDELLSVELCGGTHVAETGQIGSFFITEQSSVAAGIKRITALTGPKVSTRLQDVQAHLDRLANKFNVSVKQLDGKIDKTMTELGNITSLIANVAEEYVHNLPENNFILASHTIQYILHLDMDGIGEILGFASMIDALKISGYDSRVVYTKAGQYALFHPQAKELLKKLGIKGGGSDTFVQGRDEKIVELLS